MDAVVPQRGWKVLLIPACGEPGVGLPKPLLGPSLLPTSSGAEVTAASQVPVRSPKSHLSGWALWGLR